MPRCSAGIPELLPPPKKGLNQYSTLGLEVGPLEDVLSPLVLVVPPLLIPTGKLCALLKISKWVSTESIKRVRESFGFWSLNAMEFERINEREREREANKADESKNGEKQEKVDV